MNRLAALACAAPLLLAACATTPPPQGRVITSAQANTAGLGGAATAPLRDLDLLRTRIPPVLLDALKNPYLPPDPYSCAEIRAKIVPLDDALGPDYDRPDSAADPSLLAKGNKAILDAAAGAAQDVIPLRSWVRRLSGAQQHDKLVAAAIEAGGVRRGYLKGVGESKNCGTTTRKALNLVPF
jgi:hypothetical protein